MARTIREEWQPKHQRILKVYRVQCQGCEADYYVDSATANPELYCPFCDEEEPMKTEEVLKNE